MSSAGTPTTAAPEIGRELATLVGDRHVTASAQALAQIGADPGRGGAWIVRPGSAAEVAEVVRLAGLHGVAVVPVGTGGRAPRTHALADRARFFVDARRMDHVLHLDETSLIVHVQAGLTAMALEKVLAPRGLSLGDYPPAALGSTIGGLLSVRTPGKSSPRHGFVEDAVLGVSAVLADGRTVHTRVAPRRSTGPDLARALCGSEGTLGFITSAVLRIHRRPEARFLAAHLLPSFRDALSAVRLALREEAAPAAMRVYDCDEARAHLGGESCTDGAAILVAATAGPTDLAACDRGLIASAAEAEGGRELDKSVAEIWWRRRIGHDGGADAAPPVPALQVTASLTKLAPVYGAVTEAVATHGGRARAHASRFEADGGVLFFTFVTAEGAIADGDHLARARNAAETAAVDAGAHLLGSANPSLESYMDALRRTLDPRGIMNPGALRSSS